MSRSLLLTWLIFDAGPNWPQTIRADFDMMALRMNLLLQPRVQTRNCNMLVDG